MIYANEKSPSSYFSPNGAERFKDDMEYIVGTAGGSGIYEPDGRNLLR